MVMIFRDYTQTDEPVCMEIFDSNTPPFFDISERAKFLAFLRRQSCPFFVIETGDRVVACGGFCEESNKDIVLAWGMVHRDLHKQGYGTLLLQERIKRIRAMHPGQRIVIDTSQYSQEFFRRNGFSSVNTIENHYGPGLHRIDMALRIE